MSKNKRMSLIWRGEVIGFIELLGIETFHLYGNWFPLDTPLAKEFATAIALDIEFIVEIDMGTSQFSTIVDRMSFNEGQIDFNNYG
jgi:hypothetical protein